MDVQGWIQHFDLFSATNVKVAASIDHAEYTHSGQFAGTPAPGSRLLDGGRDGRAAYRILNAFSVEISGPRARDNLIVIEGQRPVESGVR